MKFVCDRCNTRYSIGDDRVRGKILKIRCKTCSNVITVREGMPSFDAADGDPAEPAGAGAGAAVASGAAAARRAHKSTTLAPTAQSESAAPPASPRRGALGAAFASAMAKPPAAPEDEWYVSLDGDQAGPFGVAEAQRWVAERPAEAELFCWREGFDDWLPVDDVSHFRGLRRAAAPPSPAPRPAHAPASDPAPRPLFAATMAQLEQGAAPSELRGLGGRAAGPPNGQAVTGPAPLGAGAPAARGGPAPLSALSAFDASDSATQLEPGLFEADAAATAPRLSALDRGAPAGAGLGGLAAPGLADPGGIAADAGAGDDLDIGEVSRVVKLADLARDAGRGGPAATPAPQPALGPARNPTGVLRSLGGAARSPTGAMPRLEVPRLGELAPSPLANGTGHAAVLLPAPEVPPPASNRRALVALIAGAVVLVGVAVGVVFFVLSSGDERGGSRLGQVDQIDTTRPEEVRPVGGGDGSGSAVAIVDPPAGSGAPRTTKRIVAPPTGPGSSAGPEGPEGGARLEAREIEEMAGKNSSITQRCYMRAQRGAEGILIGDVKKISVTLTINADGQVTEALLSDNHAQDSLGKCLLGAIRSWRFRPSPGGTFRFVLHFG